MALDIYFPPGYGTHTFKWQNDDNGINAVNTFAFRNIPDLTAEEAANELNTMWAASGAPASLGLLSDQWRKTGSYTLIQKVGYQISWEVTGGGIGTVVGGSPPASNSIVVNKKTLRAGKRYRGRFAWPAGFVLETNVDAGGTIATPTLIDLQESFDDVLDEMVTANLPMVLLHTRLTVDEVPTPTTVEALKVSALMGIQRRRSGR